MSHPVVNHLRALMARGVSLNELVDAVDVLQCERVKQVYYLNRFIQTVKWLLVERELLDN